MTSLISNHVIIVAWTNRYKDNIRVRVTRSLVLCVCSVDRCSSLKSDSTHHVFGNSCTKCGSLRFSVFRLFTAFICLYTYEFWLSLWKILRSFFVFFSGNFVTTLIYPFSFGHYVVCPSIYGFWLPLWYLRNIFPF